MPGIAGVAIVLFERGGKNLRIRFGRPDFCRDGDGGEEISQRPPSERDIAFVFQMFALYPHMNVRRNTSYPLG